MEIKAPQVIKLRESTGLGMMTCKKALIEADGDMEMAIDNLRKQGQMTAAKRAGRVAKEGKVSIVIKDSDALIYEVNSETDFVARNKDFLSFVENLGKIIIDKKPADMEKTMALTSPLFEDQTIEAKILEIIGKIGEKISFRRFKLISTDPTKERAVSYIHGNGKIGVLVVISADKSELLDSQSIADLGKDLAMQITALKPIAVTRENMPKEIIEKEREIYLSQVKSSGKPEKIWDKIVTGKLNKFFKQTALLEQEFIKDSDSTVTDRIKLVEKENEIKINVSSFVRFELGVEE